MSALSDYHAKNSIGFITNNYTGFDFYKQIILFNIIHFCSYSNNKNHPLLQIICHYF